jgi:hypothetical protein
MAILENGLIPSMTPCAALSTSIFAFAAIAWKSSPEDKFLLCVPTFSTHQ